MSSDRDIIHIQLGRDPRGDWRTSVRCSHGAPVVIVTRPTLEDGEPFPTLFWLTCPVLRTRVSRLESDGATDEWTRRLAEDPGLAERMRVADEVYRRLRQAEAPSSDRCAVVGIAGQRDPLKVKCLHAHVAACLAGVCDPVGEAVLGDTGWECTDGRCMEEDLT